MGGEYSTDGSVSLSLALLRHLFKCVRFAFRMGNVNVQISLLTTTKKIKKKNL